MIKFSKIWEGVIPPYFDVNNSIVLNENLLCLCLKNENNDRELLVYDLKTLKVLVNVKVYWTTILGVSGENIYLAKIEDARSHLQASRIGCYNYKTRTNVPLWKGSLLYEKYRFTPQRIKENLLKVGKYYFNFNNNTFSLNDYPLEDDLVVKLKNSDCITINVTGVTYLRSSHEAEWRNGDVKSWWYQFSTYDKMFFLKPGNLLCTLEIETGHYREELINLPFEIKRITGDWVHVNDKNFNFTSIYDGCIYKNCLFFVDPKSNKMVSNNGFEWQIPNANNGHYYIVATNFSYILLLRIGVGEYGEIFVMSTEDEE